jgi:polyisoprenoid-binding protein YceI
VGDTVRWQNVRGKIDVDVKTINTGLRMRDNFLHGILEAERFRNITFQIDSVVSVQPGDTIKAIAVGVLHVRGSTTPLRIPVKAFREGSGLRVVGQVMQPSSIMTDVWNLSKFKLGLGVGMSLWKEIHMGVDLVLAKAAPGSSP